MGVYQACVRASVHTFKHEYLCNQGGLITMKFYQKHHLGVGKAALGFGPERIRTLVSMATDSSLRVIMGNRCCLFFSAVIHPILFILAGKDGMHESSEEFEIRHDSNTDCGVSCPLASEKIPIDL